VFWKLVETQQEACPFSLPETSITIWTMWQAETRRQLSNSSSSSRFVIYSWDFHPWKELLTDRQVSEEICQSLCVVIKHSELINEQTQRRLICVSVQNFWVIGLCPSSGVLETIKHKVSETGFFPILRWRGRKLPNRVGASLLHLRAETEPVSEMLCFLDSITSDNRQRPENSIILSITPSSGPFRIYVWVHFSCPHGFEIRSDQSQNYSQRHWK
jgi:hypothetical protein